jgi:hypothetical protein
LVVQVTDETGTPVPDALVSFRLPEDGVSGLFRNGLKTEILSTGADGQVALHTLRTGGLAGQFQIRMTAAKGAARAGALSTQFIRPEPVHHSLGILRRKRMLEVGAVVLAVAVAGYMKQRGGGSAKVETPPTIGSPTITIGKP